MAKGYVLCPVCNNVLGELVAGVLVVRHSRRELVIDTIVAIRCEDCGQVWRPAVQAGTIPPASAAAS